MHSNVIGVLFIFINRVTQWTCKYAIANRVPMSNCFPVWTGWSLACGSQEAFFFSLLHFYCIRTMFGACRWRLNDAAACHWFRGSTAACDCFMSWTEDIFCIVWTKGSDFRMQICLSLHRQTQWRQCVRHGTWQQICLTNHEQDCIFICRTPCTSQCQHTWPQKQYYDETSLVLEELWHANIFLAGCMSVQRHVLFQ